MKLAKAKEILTEDEKRRKERRIKTTIPKAIEILQLEETGDFDGTIHDRNDAIRLGIKALKRVKDTRQYPYIAPSCPLPGETEEE